MQQKLLNQMIADAQQKIDNSTSQLQQAEQDLKLAVHRLKTFDQPILQAEKKLPDSKLESVFLSDDFSDSEHVAWKPLNGKWEFNRGHVAQKKPGSWMTMITNNHHPQEFQARVRYTTTEPGKIHSVGIAFDVVGRKDWQAIYTYVSNGKSAVQAFHRKNGQEFYPSAGIVPHPINIDQEVILDLVVRGSQLNVWVNDELKIVYTLPLSRQAGKFALWTHSGTAIFHEVQIEKLPSEFQIAKSSTERIKSPFAELKKTDLQNNVQRIQMAIEFAKLQRTSLESELVALHARIAAEKSRLISSKEFQELSKRAFQAERQYKVHQAELALLKAEQDEIVARSQPSGKSSKKSEAVSAAGKKINSAKKGLNAAKAAMKKEGNTYTPLGKIYPQQSTGRRLALARWIANRNNPRTSRVAVNHIWLRHFGKAIVPSVADFGVRSKPRSHPHLLDWLAVRFVENNWSMKWLHRLIVTSHTYRLSSSEGKSSRLNAQRDPDNTYLWRMNLQRMQAEVIRDSILHLSGQLDLKQGGPELAESLGQQVKRRSIYFRSTPNSQMEFLELFDLANPDECYERKESVIPQQALALTNSSLALTHARLIARNLEQELSEQGKVANASSFITAAFEQVLSRKPLRSELIRCQKFLESHQKILANIQTTPAFPATAQKRLPAAENHVMRAKENLVHVLINHNEFISIR